MNTYLGRFVFINFIIFYSILYGAYSTTIKSGWNLLGGISNLQVNKLPKEVENSWFYSDGKWTSIVPYLENTSKTYFAGVGFWAQSSKDTVWAQDEVAQTSIPTHYVGWNLLGAPEDLYIQTILDSCGSENVKSVFTYSNSSWLSYILNQSTALRVIPRGDGFWLNVIDKCAKIDLTKNRPSQTDEASVTSSEVQTINQDLTEIGTSLSQSIIAINSFIFLDKSKTSYSKIVERGNEAEKALHSLTNLLDKKSLRFSRIQRSAILRGEKRGLLGDGASFIFKNSLDAVNAVQSYTTSLKNSTAKVFENLHRDLTYISGSEDRVNEWFETSEKLAAVIRDTSGLVVTVGSTVLSAGIIASAGTVAIVSSAIINTSAVIKTMRSGSELLLGDKNYITNFLDNEPLLNALNIEKAGEILSITSLVPDSKSSLVDSIYYMGTQGIEAIYNKSVSFGSDSVQIKDIPELLAKRVVSDEEDRKIAWDTYKGASRQLVSAGEKLFDITDKSLDYIVDEFKKLQDDTIIQSVMQTYLDSKQQLVQAGVRQSFAEGNYINHVTNEQFSSDTISSELAVAIEESIEKIEKDTNIKQEHTKIIEDAAKTIAKHKDIEVIKTSNDQLALLKVELDAKTYSPDISSCKTSTSDLEKDSNNLYYGCVTETYLGELRQITYYEKSKKNGKFYKYGSYGNVLKYVEIYTYEDDVITGEYVKKRSNGDTMIYGQYLNGNKSANWEHYFGESGDKEDITIGYKDGEITSIIGTYFRNGYSTYLKYSYSKTYPLGLVGDYYEYDSSNNLQEHIEFFISGGIKVTSYRDLDSDGKRELSSISKFYIRKATSKISAHSGYSSLDRVENLVYKYSSTENKVYKYTNNHYYNGYKHGENVAFTTGGSQALVCRYVNGTYLSAKNYQYDKSYLSSEEALKNECKAWFR